MQFSKNACFSILIYSKYTNANNFTLVTKLLITFDLHCIDNFVLNV